MCAMGDCEGYSACCLQRMKIFEMCLVGERDVGGFGKRKHINFIIILHVLIYFFFCVTAHILRLYVCAFVFLCVQHRVLGFAHGSM